jgi:hypothetical protein
VEIIRSSDKSQQDRWQSSSRWRSSINAPSGLIHLADSLSAAEVWQGFLIMAPGVFIGAHLAHQSEPRQVAIKALGVAVIVGVVVLFLPIWNSDNSLYIGLIVVWVETRQNAANDDGPRGRHV